jgi:hypothetical protein
VFNLRAPFLSADAAVVAAQFLVAQIFNLLYRRIAFGRAWKIPTASKLRRSADCKSAIRQNAILRYDCGAVVLKRFF